MQKKFITIYTWNVNGIRAAAKKGFPDWVKKSKGDIICLQEIKAMPEQIPEELKNIKGYETYWFSAERKGYSGVGTYTKIKPVNTFYGFGKEKFDIEGRVIISEFKKFVLANVYFPNGGRGPERVKYKLDFYDELFAHLNKYREKKKGVIVTGDYNTAHNEIDLARPKENEKNTGFLPEERAWIDTIINIGYVDIFRKFNNQPNQYTYWDMFTRARERNVGWRIDYFMVSEDLVKNVVSAKIHPDVYGSDHCPVSIKIKL